MSCARDCMFNCISCSGTHQGSAGCRQQPPCKAAVLSWCVCVLSCICCSGTHKVEWGAGEKLAGAAGRGAPGSADPGARQGRPGAAHSPPHQAHPALHTHHHHHCGCKEAAHLPAEVLLRAPMPHSEFPVYKASVPHSKFPTAVLEDLCWV